MNEVTAASQDDINDIPQKPIHQTVSVPFQVVCIVLSLAWFSFIALQRLAIFDALEGGPEIIQITPPIYQKFGGTATFVTTGLLIERFSIFDMVNNVFEFNGYIWFKSVPGTLSLDNLAKFSFAQGEILEQSAPETQIIDAQLLSTFYVKVKFSSLLDYQKFPFDDHRLRITLMHNAFSPEEIIFQSSEQDLTIKTDPINYGWHQLNLVVEPGFIESAIDTYDKRSTQYHPAVTYTIDYERYGVRFILIILLPLLLIYYVSLFGFSLDEYSAVKNAIGSVTGILGYRFVVDTLSPKVGYFMIADYIFFTILTCAMIALIIHIITLYAGNMTLRVKQYLLIALHLLTNGFSAYFFFM